MGEEGMSSDRLAELRIAAGGLSEIAKARQKANDAARLGDTASEQYWIKRFHDLEAAADRLAARRLRRQEALKGFDLERGDLVGGVTGVALVPSTEVSLAPGVTLKSTYAHLMLPSIIATAPPPDPTAPHPGPWFQSGGMGVDILVEVSIQGSVQASGFDALNAAWLATALIRLRVNPDATMPLVASVSLAQLPATPDATLLPIEAAPTSMFRLPVGERRTLKDADVAWLCDHYLAASSLCRESNFLPAFVSFDEAPSSPNPRSRMLILWSALEALFRPGRPNTGDRLGKAAAVMLAGGVSDRDAIFREVRDRYQRRGDIAHASLTPTVTEVEELGVLAASCFQRVIEAGRIPSLDELLTQWRTRTMA